LLSPAIADSNVESRASHGEGFRHAKRVKWGETKPVRLVTALRGAVKGVIKCSQTYARRAAARVHFAEQKFTMFAVNDSLHCFSNSRNDSSITVRVSSITEDCRRLCCVCLCPGFPFTASSHAPSTIESDFSSCFAQLRRGMTFGKPWNFFSHPNRDLREKLLSRNLHFFVVST
jgi:hypothetical protein